MDIRPGARGVTVEYNPYLGDAGTDGAAPLVGVIMHKLLHFEAHLGQRAPQLAVKSGSKDKEALLPVLSYLLTVTDHAWVVARLKQLNPALFSAQSRWGLDLVTMLVGSESMFNRYLSERNLTKLLDVSRDRQCRYVPPRGYRAPIHPDRADTGTRKGRIAPHIPGRATGERTPAQP